MAKHVKPGPGQDIRKYSDKDLIARTATKASRGDSTSQLTGEMARRIVSGQKR